jgi:hypothetical protein
MEKAETTTGPTTEELILKLVDDGATTIYKIDDPENFNEQCAKKRNGWGLHPSAKDLKKICSGYVEIDEQTFNRVKKGLIDRWSYSGGLNCELYVVRGYKREKSLLHSPHVLEMQTKFGKR